MYTGNRKDLRTYRLQQLSQQQRRPWKHPWLISFPHQHMALRKRKKEKRKNVQPDFHSSASLTSFDFSAATFFFSCFFFLPQKRRTTMVRLVFNHSGTTSRTATATLCEHSRRTSFSAFLALPDSFFAFPPLGAMVCTWVRVGVCARGFPSLVLKKM